MKITDKFVFFYKEWPGNYTKSSFYWNFDKKNKFFCTEQAFMYAKAVYFEDYESSAMILDCRIANTCRLLGRNVKNYDDKKWDSVRFDIMKDCNFAKYSQDKKLCNFLIDDKYDGLVFVEASPIDKIWGIGMDENNPLINDENNWKGQNRLGKILTTIREDLKNGKRYQT